MFGVGRKASRGETPASAAAEFELLGNHAPMGGVASGGVYPENHVPEGGVAPIA